MQTLLIPANPFHRFQIYAPVDSSANHRTSARLPGVAGTTKSDIRIYGNGTISDHSQVMDQSLKTINLQTKEKQMKQALIIAVLFLAALPGGPLSAQQNAGALKVQPQPGEKDSGPQRQSQIVVDPQNLTFNVAYGSNASGQINISNTGTEPLDWHLHEAGEMPSQGMVAWFPFNGNAIDESGNGHDGTIYGTSWGNDRNGNPNSAVDVLYNQRIVFGSNNLPSGSAPRTLGCWFKARNFVSGGWPDWLVGYGNANPGSPIYQLQLHSNGQIEFQTGSWLNRIFSTHTFRDGEWHCAMVTYNGTTVTMYVDGQYEGSVSPGGIGTASDQFSVGKCLWWGCYYDGLVDDVFLYNRVLTPEEIYSVSQAQSMPAYLTLTPQLGVLPPGGSVSLQIGVNTLQMQAGTTIDTLLIISNDPAAPAVPVIITTNVLPPAPVITPSPLYLLATLEDPVTLGSFELENQGPGLLNYHLNGEDGLGMFMPAIPGYAALGEFDGHRYYASSGTSTWSAAKLACEAVGGHLAAITSSPENDFIASHYSPMAWIGTRTDLLVNNVWCWVNGEPVTYTNWASGQPDNWNGENCVEINRPAGQWNDASDNHHYDNVLIHHILEFDSILNFLPTAGSLAPDASEEISLFACGYGLADGIYHVWISVSAPGMEDPVLYPVTLQVDFTAPLAVTGLTLDEDLVTFTQAGFHWDANAPADTVVAYNIYRRNDNDGEWFLLESVPAGQLTYVDTDFDSYGYRDVFYCVRAKDNHGNQSPQGVILQANMDRFPPPAGLTIQRMGNDVQLTWSPVNQTLGGVTVDPSCYVIYVADALEPLSGYQLVDISLTNQYLHVGGALDPAWDAHFYYVAAYIGDLARLKALLGIGAH